MIDLETGLILDYEAYSLYCHVSILCSNLYIYVCFEPLICNQACICNKKALSTANFESWYAALERKGDCAINYTGSTGGMEVSNDYLITCNF